MTKTLSFDGIAISAENAAFYVALYSNAACTNRVSEIMALGFEDAHTSTVVFANLEKNTTYYVSECDVEGNAIASGAAADGTLYYADFVNGNKAVTEGSAS